MKTFFGTQNGSKGYTDYEKFEENKQKEEKEVNKQWNEWWENRNSHQCEDKKIIEILYALNTLFISLIVYWKLLIFLE